MMTMHKAWIGWAGVTLLAGSQLCHAGDLAVNNATVEGDVRLHQPGNPFNVAVRYRIGDDGTETQTFADSDRTGAEWWWRAYLNATEYKALMVLDGGANENSSLWLYDDSNVSTDIRLAAKGDSYFSAGRLGLGTTTPSEKLDVVGTVKATGFQLTTAPTAGYVLTSDPNGVGTWQEVTGGSGGSGQPTGPAGGDLTGDYPNPTLASSAASLGKVSGGAMVSDGANVGIGTAPSEKLDVLGTIKATGLQLTTSPADGYVLTSDVNGLASWQELPVGGPAVPTGLAGGDLTGDYPNPTLAIAETSLSKVSGNAMVSQAGKIGIGTTTPSAELHVEGRVHISDVLHLEPSNEPNNPQRGDIYFDGNILWIYTNRWRQIRIR